MTRKYKITVVGTGYVGMSIAALLGQHNEVGNLDLSYELPDLDVRPFIKRSSDFREKYKAEKVPDLATRFNSQEEFDATLNKLLGYTRGSWEKKLPIIL